MAWRGPRTARDPLLASKQHRANQQYWRTQRLPCAICGAMIMYDGPYYLPGTRRLNPRSLVVGHIVSRHRAKQLGWTERQINALTNTRPECRDCSNKGGARLGQKVQHPRTPTYVSRW